MARNKRRRFLPAPAAAGSEADAPPSEQQTRYGLALLVPELSGIAKIVRQLMENAHDPNALVNSLKELEKLVDEENGQWKKHQEESCRHYGAHGVVIGTMSNWPYHDGIQESGCICLQRMSFLDDNEAPIVDSGGIEAACNALITFPNQVSIQWAGCGTLRNLLFGVKGASRFVRGHGGNGLALVVKTMERFSDDHDDDDDVLIECFAILENLAANNFRGPLLEAGAASAVAKIIKKYPPTVDMHKLAKECMVKICAR